MKPDLPRRQSGVNTSTTFVASDRDDRAWETEQAGPAAREITPLASIPLVHTPGKRERESSTFASGLPHERRLEQEIG
jgi:hypothetical protein